MVSQMEDTMTNNSSHYNELELSLDELGYPVSMLSEEELDAVSGGFKWDHNYVSKDVIDARGGQVTVLGFNITLDVNGKPSSIS
jgi:hypothetical protein